MLTPNEEDMGAENADHRTPLLKTTLSRQNQIRQRIARLLGDWWLWEILGATIAVLAILAIVAILLTYDSSSLPGWPSVFTVRQYSRSPRVFHITKLCNRSIPSSLILPPSQSFPWVLPWE